MCTYYFISDFIFQIEAFPKMSIGFKRQTSKIPPLFSMMATVSFCDVLNNFFRYVSRITGHLNWI